MSAPTSLQSLIHAPLVASIDLTAIRHYHAVAQAAGTLGYELLSKVSARVPRRYHS